jgi:hypothetical protein
MGLELKNSYVQWLAGYDWTWFGTLTLRNGIRRKNADRLFRSWIRDLEEIEGRPLSWARMGEYSQENHRFHFHVLVAGVQRCDPTFAELRWERMAGDALIDIYEPGERGLPYMLKSIEDGPDFDIDMELKDEHKLRGDHERCG